MSDGQPNNGTSTKSRGFGAMDREKQREIARRGGKAAHAKGVAHRYSADEARSAGRKGGQTISANRDHMAQIGRLGGLARRTARSTQEESATTPTEQTNGHLLHVDQPTTDSSPTAST